MMTLNDYQQRAMTTCLPESENFAYMMLNLVGEVGEIAGDIIRAGDEKTLLEVRFVRGVFAFLCNGDIDDEFPCNAPTQEWAEVVGNIHDNPKMIKRK